MYCQLIILVSVFLIIGFIFRTGKAAFLISGFNSLTPCERKKWNENKLSKFAGNIFLLISLLYIIALIITYTFPKTSKCTFSYVTSFSIVIGLSGAIYVNFSKRFKK